MWKLFYPGPEAWRCDSTGLVPTTRTCWKVARTRGAARLRVGTGLAVPRRSHMYDQTLPAPIQIGELSRVAAAPITAVPRPSARSADLGLNRLSLTLAGVQLTT